MPQLGVRAARHHPPQLRQPRVRAHAVHLLGQAQPGPAPGGLHRPGEGDCLDDRAPDRRHPARPLQRLPPHQRAAAGRRRRPRTWPVAPPERVELGEEVHEGRHDQPLPPRLHPQPRHLRHQVQPVRLRRRHQLGQRVRPVRDVRVRQQQVLGVRPRQLHPVPHRPQLARPARRQRGRGGHRQLQAPRGGERTRQRTGAVRAVVVHQHHPGPPRVLLRQQARQGQRQHLRLVPGRHHHRHLRPPPGRTARRQTDIGTPEQPVAARQPEPDQQGEHSDPQQDGHPGSLPHQGPAAGHRLKS